MNRFAQNPTAVSLLGRKKLRGSREEGNDRSDSIQYEKSLG
jgi:hypothetical protein